MSRETFEAWIPEEFDSAVVQRVSQVSAVEATARHIPMGSTLKSEPRSGAATVASIAKGGAYGEDSATNDSVVLSAAKLGTAFRIADEDINDSLADILSAKGIEWATSFGIFFDNATLAVTAAANGTTIPFNSVYYQLTQTNSATSYTSGANITKSTTAGVTYANLSTALGLLETSAFYDGTNVMAIAHPTFKGVLRNIVDGQQRPIFQAGVAGGADEIFGVPIKWSLGAKTHATASSAPSGNPLLVFANTNYLLVGDRSNPESMFIDGKTGVGALTDEAILKYRARKGFNIGYEAAFSILEKAF